MPSDTEKQLISLIEELDIFDSSYHSRILAYLVIAADQKNAMQISQDLDIPDSKVYPTLNALQDLGLIRVIEGRPKQYYFDQPEKLDTYFRECIKQRYQRHLGMVDRIIAEASKIWEPEEYLLDNIAQIYRGGEITNELARHLKLTKNHLFIFLSEKFDFYKLLEKYLPQVSHDKFRLEIVLPSGRENFVSYLEREMRGKIKLRRSLWDQNSFIIRDERVMMNMFHADNEMALLTNDELLVRNIRQCWDDPECCTTTNIVQLELPEDVTLERINLS